MISDQALTRLLLQCDNIADHYATLDRQEQTELLQFCREIIKYGGVTHEIAGGKVFTDPTLLRPAKKLVKGLKRKKD